MRNRLGWCRFPSSEKVFSLSFLYVTASKGHLVSSSSILYLFIWHWTSSFYLRSFYLNSHSISSSGLAYILCVYLRSFTFLNFWYSWYSARRWGFKVYSPEYMRHRDLNRIWTPYTCSHIKWILKRTWLTTMNAYLSINVMHLPN